jgi:hypothetical protein
VENIASFLELVPATAGQRERNPPFTAIISFGASKKRQDLFEAFVEANLHHPRSYQTESLFVPEQLLINMAIEVGERSPAHPYGSYAPAPPVDANYWMAAKDTGEDSTLLFYLLLTASLANYTPPIYSPWEYARRAGLLPDGLVLYWDRDDAPDAVHKNRQARRRRTAQERERPRDYRRRTRPLE